MVGVYPPAILDPWAGVAAFFLTTMRLVPDDACGDGSVFMASTFIEELF